MKTTYIIKIKVVCEKRNKPIVKIIGGDTIFCFLKEGMGGDTILCFLKEGMTAKWSIKKEKEE